MHTTCGTLNYIAPEIVKNTGYDGQMADIWACGVILYFMLTGKRPFDDESVHKLLDKIIIGDYKFPVDEKKVISEDAKDLIKSILNPNPRKRYNIEMIKLHRWFSLGFEDYIEEENYPENWSASEIP
jgi:5'-AMP-activated protein kinase catalytic alpha subunit